MPNLKTSWPVVLAGALWAAPLLPAGCSGVDVAHDPDFLRGVAILEESKALAVGGLTPEELAKFERLGAEFKVVADRLQGRLEADEAQVRNGIEAAKPFIPEPFNSLVDPLAMGFIYLFLRRKHGAAFEALRGDFQALQDQVRKPA